MDFPSALLTTSLLFQHALLFKQSLHGSGTYGLRRGDTAWTTHSLSSEFKKQKERKWRKKGNNMRIHKNDSWVNVSFVQCITSLSLVWLNTNTQSMSLLLFLSVFSFLFSLFYFSFYSFFHSALPHFFLSFFKIHFYSFFFLSCFEESFCVFFHSFFDSKYISVSVFLHLSF